MRLPIASAAVFVCLTACAPTPTPTAEPRPATTPTATASTPKADPAEVMRKLEQRLLSAAEVTATCKIEATGAIAANVDATLRLTSQTKHRLEVNGAFADIRGKRGLDHNEPTSLVSMTDEGKPGSTNIVQTPQKMREALVFGLTRMGLLHNIARLYEGELPDHVQGGADQWVTTAAHRWAESSPDGNPVIAFDVIVEGTKAATATLVFDAKGLPVERRQRVQFESGVMEVVERCSWQ